MRIREFSDLPQYSGYYGPTSIASLSGSLWVTETIDQDYGENAVVQIATSGQMLHAFYYGGRSTEGASFQDIVVGPDGALWITDYYNEQILKFTTNGRYTNFPLQNYCAPIGITSGPDKALWFTTQCAGGSASIGRITTSGRIRTYSVASYAEDIAAGDDGALWFTQPTSDQIGRITTHGKITEYSKGISAGAGPYSIVSGPDGALWFTEQNGGRIGRITRTGTVTEYSNGITPSEKPYDLAAGPDGAMWFTEYEIVGSYQTDASKIGRITMHGKIREYSKGLTSQAEPTDIVAGPDGRMWFVETASDKTGRVTI
ncbi:MAG: Virginiamycin B lyase [Candidatus Eremiobacteraeota bacterium]|nr:Virginiamycin B lyase [Candidatus Eremiobacteraeota bacterium]